MWLRSGSPPHWLVDRPFPDFFLLFLFCSWFLFTSEVLSTKPWSFRVPNFGFFSLSCIGYVLSLNSFFGCVWAVHLLFCFFSFFFFLFYGRASRTIYIRDFLRGHPTLRLLGFLAPARFMWPFPPPPSYVSPPRLLCHLDFSGSRRGFYFLIFGLPNLISFFLDFFALLHCTHFFLLCCWLLDRPSSLAWACLVFASDPLNPHFQLFFPGFRSFFFFFVHPPLVGLCFPDFPPHPVFFLPFDL